MRNTSKYILKKDYSSITPSTIVTVIIESRENQLKVKITFESIVIDANTRLTLGIPIPVQGHLKVKISFFELLNHARTVACKNTGG